jgi:hypothetical protein
MKMKLTPRIFKKLAILSVTIAPVAAGTTIAIHYFSDRLGIPPAVWFTLCCWAIWGYAGFALGIRVIRNNQEP